MDERRDSNRLVGGLVLLGLGLLFLLSNFGYSPSGLWDRWWPLILIAIGLIVLLRRPEPAAIPPEPPFPPGETPPGMPPAPPPPPPTGRRPPRPPPRTPRSRPASPRPVCRRRRPRLRRPHTGGISPPGRSS